MVIEKTISPSAPPFDFFHYDRSPDENGEGRQTGVQSTRFRALRGAAADAASDVHRRVHLVFGRPVLLRAAVGCNCAKMRGHAPLIAKDTPSRIGSNARDLFGRQRASQAAPARDMSRRQQMPSALAAHIASFFFSLSRPPHHCVFLDKGQTSAERKKLQHASRHAIAATRRTRLSSVQLYVRATTTRTHSYQETARPDDARQII